MQYLLSDNLVNFIEDFFGKYDFELTKSTLIENDLGITGEDGHDLIIEYSKLFKVNISEFIFSKYFYPEPSLFVEYGKIEPLTLGDLEEGILNGFLK
ncbi:DUF1493 family protein [Tenacibaculum sp. 190524A02b]|uniref:DUF1493 family protein n=1 Tax=Tenacibaculum vairaonense TaxID=3137860 RepID=UPI0031FB21F5